MQAYNTLINRYENKGAIIQSHVRSLFETPKVQTASAMELQKLHHHIMSNVNAFKALEQPVEFWDAWLVTLVCNRMDSATVGERQLQYNKKDLPTFRAIESFLFNRIAAYEAGEINAESLGKKPISRANTKYQERKAFFVKQFDNPKFPSLCLLCNESHKLYACTKFNNLSVPERRDFVRSKQLCYLSLASNHQCRQCKFAACPKCGARHNSKLHLDNVTNETRIQETSVQPTQSTLCTNQTSLHVTNAANEDQVMLATAIVYLNDSKGQRHQCRALLDSGSQVSFISSSCAKRLRLSTTNCHIPISGINTIKTNAQQLEPVIMTSQFGDFSETFNFYVLPSISSNMPSRQINRSCVHIPNSINERLADPSYVTPRTIELLIGADIFFELFSGTSVVIGDRAFAYETKLGWIITEHLPVLHSSEINQINNKSALSLKSLPVTSLFSKKITSQVKEEEAAESQFQKTVSRDSTGRFVVRLPFKQHPTALGNSKAMAEKRFLTIERKLATHKSLALDYHAFMKEYLDMGHMNPVSQEALEDQPVYYLPHHAVLKADSLTTKTRVVFDASAVTTSGLSLNDIMCRGPTIQQPLVNIILRFRLHHIVLTADIMKMYRQIRVADEDCNMQRILYRTSPSDPLQEFHLLTVTYGTKAAPFLATRCLAELAHTCQNLSGSKDQKC
jgi:hypothetical protein